MLRVGLTGGLATGKSHVGAAFERLGCHLLKADELGHRALEPSGGAYESVVSAFGPGIVSDEGLIDRRKLAAIVFQNAGLLAQLNAIIHPIVIRAEENWFERISAEDPAGLGIVEAAILIETGSYKRFDKIILTVCSREEQIARSMKRDHLTREEVEERLKRQMPLNEKRKYADYVIDTSGERSATSAQVEALYEVLRRVKQ